MDENEIGGIIGTGNTYNASVQFAEEASINAVTTGALTSVVDTDMLRTAINNVFTGHKQCFHQEGVNGQS